MLAKISKKSIIATNTLAVNFTLERPLKFQAGQFFFLELKNTPQTDTKGNTRHFTIVNAPENDREIEMATRLSDSAFKKSLAEMTIGTEVEINGPSGNFLLPDNQQLIMIAGGIGITPFISQLRQIKNKNLAYKISLLYFNKDLASTAFYDELRQQEKVLADFQLIPIMSADKDWPGEQGLISSEIIKKYSQQLNQPDFMVVGPPAMVDLTLAELKKLNISQERIKVENFTGY